MALDKRLTGILNRLIYGAQFDYPMSLGASRIYEMEVDASRPTHPIPKMLSDIQAILAEVSIPIASKVAVRRSEQEIRDFLQRLAEEIEQRNPNVIRPGQPVPQSGQWFCYGKLEHTVSLSKGDIAPDYRPACTVWVLAPANVRLTAKERVLGDFKENFIPNALRGIQYQDPEEYAQAAFERLSSGADAQTLADLSTVLNQLIQHPDAPLLDEIKNASGFDWTENDVRWTFLQKFVDGLIRRIAAKERAEIPNGDD